MAGQCEFHPFEQAADVCGVCYADICTGCVTTVRSRPEPICRDCALTMSGVRGSSKTQIRGDKSTVAARRAALHPQEPVEDQATADDTEWIRDDAGGIRGKLNAMAAGFLPGDGSGKKPNASQGRPGVGITRTKKSPKAAFADDSAVHKLDQIRRGGSDPAAEPSKGPKRRGGEQPVVEHTPSLSQEVETAGPDAWPELDEDELEQSEIDGAGQADWEPLPEQDKASYAQPTLAKPTPEADWSEAAVPDLNQDPFTAR